MNDLPSDYSKLKATAFGISGESYNFLIFEVERLSEENDVLEVLTSEINDKYKMKNNVLNNNLNQIQGLNGHNSFNKLKNVKLTLKHKKE